RAPGACPRSSPWWPPTSSGSPPASDPAPSPPRGPSTGRESGGGRAMAHDLILRGGTIVDGSGAPGWQGDVVVDGGAITEVTPHAEGVGIEEIDVAGRVVSP